MHQHYRRTQGIGMVANDVKTARLHEVLGRQGSGLRGEQRHVGHHGLVDRSSSPSRYRTVSTAEPRLAKLEQPPLDPESADWFAAMSCSL
jgi:hypothetical protein